jgi:CheY-like chemotaxis protein
MTDSSFDTLVDHLRSALNHLYDPDELRRSPLAVALGIAGDFDAAATLQRILIDAIEALRPGTGDPPQSRAWRIYDALFYRYIRGFDRDVVADQLGISGRQLRREQRAALEVLTQHLWLAHDLAGRSLPATAREPVSAPAWLKDLPPEKPGELQAVLRTTLELALPLARQWNVRLAGLPPDTAAEVTAAPVPQTALRYALLNVLGVAIPRATGGVVHLAGSLADETIALHIAASQVQEAGPLSEEERTSLEVARQLMAVTGGQLTTEVGADGFRARLSLPALAQVRVLVVDDNADTLQLFARYAVGTRYAVTGTREPTQALRLAEDLEPDIIILDVMMPDLDGWEMLALLREHPATSQTAVIICTVLPQQTLALGLGANAFLQKPVTRESFLTALDEQMRE